MKCECFFRVVASFTVYCAFITSLRGEGPSRGKWWPSEWGADDQRGAINRITPDKVLRAAQLISEGKIYLLGRVYEQGMPLFGNRHYSLTIISSPTGGPEGNNQIVWHDEMFSGEIGQIGTQLDGLGHVGVRIGDKDVFYNGILRTEMKGSYGLKKLGVENTGCFFTRGVLIDIASYRGVDRLREGNIITESDVRESLQKQSVTIDEGDIVLIRTGHGKLWINNNEEYNSGAPGIGMEAAKFLSMKKVVLVGSDTWCVEVVPSPDPKKTFNVHQYLLAQQGIYLLENLDLEALAKDNVYEFTFIFSPVPLKGATGSPGNPIAVR